MFYDSDIIFGEIEDGNVENVENYILDGFNPECSDINNSSCLKLAINSDCLEMVQLIYKYCTNEYQDKISKTADILTYAIYKNNLIIINYISKYIFDFFHGYNSFRILHDTMLMGNLKIFKLLVKNGACVNSINQNNITILKFAINNNNNIKYIKFMIRNNARLEFINPNDYLYI